VGRGLAYGQLGDLSRALEEFAEAKKVTPDNGWLYYHRATCYLTHGKNDLALADLKIAIVAGYPISPRKRQRALELIAELEGSTVSV
jgi:tetratricopeptide (TPR) repeat protein